MAIKRYSQADIHFTERRRMERPMLWLIWLSAAIFCCVERNFFYFGLTTLGCGICFVGSARYLEISFRRLFINIAAAAAIGWIAFEYKTRNLGMVISIGHFIMLIQICKLFERKTPVDYVLTQLLALFLIIAGALLCVELWFAFAVLAFIFLALYVSMVFTIKRGLDKAAATILPGEKGPLTPERLTWNALRNWPGKPLRRVLFTLASLSIGMGIITFLIAPRTAKSVLNTSRMSSLERTVEDTMHLGLKRQIYLSNKIVLHVKIIKNGSYVASPAESCNYLRDNILAQYSNSTWKIDRRRQPFDANHLLPISDSLRRNMVSHNISLVSATSVLPVPYPTVKITATNNNQFLCTKQLLYYNEDMPELNLKYTTSSFPQPFSKAQLDYLRSLQGWDIYTKKPSANIDIPEKSKERILELATSWTEDLLEKRNSLPAEEHGPVNIEIAKRISKKLGLEYPYTLDLREADPNRDGIEDFLFYMKKGHCEYFASALATMCCLLEVPARIATGYHFAEFDRKSKTYTIRQKDGHAWVEVYSPETNWIIVDPSPSSAVIAEKETSLWHDLKNQWQKLQVWWYSNVVGFDNETQATLQNQLSDEAVNMSKEISEYGKQLWESFKKLLMEGTVDRLLVKAFIWFIICSMSLVALMILKSVLFIFIARHTTAGKAILRKLKVVTRLIELLENNNHLFRPGETLKEWADEAVEKFNLSKQEMDFIIFLQYRWRWGSQRPSTDEIRKAISYYDNIAQIITEQKKAQRKNKKTA